MAVSDSIRVAGTGGKNIDLNLLVWDLVELFDYNPTESMFEDVVMSFGAIMQDQNMYSALVDMEKNGFAPSRPLLRYVALKLTTSEKRLAHSDKLLEWHENDHVRSTSSMNALMLGYGMKREINNAFRVFENLDSFNLTPDSNTFTFLMEILYMDTKDRFPYQPSKPEQQHNPQDIEDVIGAAEIILDAMEEAGVKKTKLFYNEQIKLLCALRMLEDAGLVLEEAISTGTPVSNSALHLLATRFADLGEYEKAHAVAESSVAAGCGDNSHLVNRINNIEKKREAS